MLNKFKIILSLFFLCLILIQSGALIFLLSMQQSIVKIKMQHALQKNIIEYEKLNLSIIEFNKYKVDKNELCINGKMYDIKSAAFYSDKVELIVVNDIEEEFIINAITDLMDSDNKQNKEFPDQIIKLLSFCYIPVLNNFEFLSQQVIQKKIAINCDFPKSHIPEIPSPPPKSNC